MGNQQCGNGAADVLTPTTEKKLLYLITNTTTPNTTQKEFDPDDIIGMTPEKACEYVSNNTSPQEKFSYIYVRKIDGESQEGKKIVNRRGLTVKTVRGVITDVHADRSPKTSRWGPNEK